METVASVRPTAGDADSEQEEPSGVRTSWGRRDSAGYEAVRPRERKRELGQPVWRILQVYLPPSSTFSFYHYSYCYCWFYYLLLLLLLGLPPPAI